jgi:tetratricopeptide (TPR) repeat protein
MFSSDPAHWGLRSLVTTTLAVDYWMGGGLYPLYFQLSTFIWHVVLCILLYYVYQQILASVFKPAWAAYLAFATAAWYAIHVVNAETLNYIISRSDVLSTFMIVCSFLVYIRWPEKRKYQLYIIPAFIGVFAKETVLVLVILLFFYILLFERELSIPKLFKAGNFKVMLQVIWQLMPLIIIIGITQVYALTRIKSVPGISNPLVPYMLTQTYVWLHYFVSFFLPLKLSADSDWTVIANPLDHRVVIGCVFIIALIITIVRTSAKKETRPIAFGLIWFSAALLPTSVAPFAEVTNDHRMYFPFIGLALSVVCYAGILIKRYEPKQNTKRYFATLFILLFCILGANAYGVHKRNQVWRNEQTLWKDVTIKSPLNGRGAMNYGLALLDAGKYPQAEEYFKRAEHIVPGYSYVYINEGILYGLEHKDTAAVQSFEKAIYFAPNAFNSYSFYAKFLFSRGKMAMAQAMAEKAQALNPYSDMALGILLQIYNQEEDWDLLEKTARQYLLVIPGDPYAEACLKGALHHTQVPPVANAPEKKVISAADYLDLSLSYYNAGDYAKCINACNQALKIQPGYADAWNNIGAACIKLKQWQNAITACQKALAINPNHTLAANNLKFAQEQLKK